MTLRLFRISGCWWWNPPRQHEKFSKNAFNLFQESLDGRFSQRLKLIADAIKENLPFDVILIDEKMPGLEAVEDACLASEKTRMKPGKGADSHRLRFG